MWKNITINASELGKHKEKREENIHNTIKSDDNIETTNIDDNESFMPEVESDDIQKFEEDLKKNEDIIKQTCLNFLLDEISIVKKQLQIEVKDEKTPRIKRKNFIKLKESLLYIYYWGGLSIKSKVIYKSRDYCKSINGLKALKNSLDRQLQMIKLHYSRIKNIIYMEDKRMIIEELIAAWVDLESICSDIIATKGAYLIRVHSQYNGNEYPYPLPGTGIIESSKSTTFALCLITYKTALEKMKSMKFFHYDEGKNMESCFKEIVNQMSNRIEISLKLIRDFKKNKIVLSHGEFYIIDTFETNLTQYMSKIKSAKIIKTEVEKFSLYVEKISEFNCLLTLIYEEIYGSDVIYYKNGDIFFNKVHDLIINLYYSIYSIVRFKDEMVLIQSRYYIMTNDYGAWVFSVAIIGYLESKIYTSYMQEILDLKLILEYLNE